MSNLRLPRLSLRKRREDAGTCADCVYYEESTSYCRKLWAPVVKQTRACKHFKPRPVKEVIKAEQS